MRTEQLAIVLAGLLLCAGGAHAEPYLMLRAGAKCGDCHTNITGGGKRTPFAHIHAKDILHDLDLLPIPPGIKPFNGELNNYVSIGADLRVRNTTVFQDKPNRAGRVPDNRAFRRGVISNDMAVFEALLYGQVDLWPDVASLYIDRSVNGGGTTREVFGLLRGFLPWDTYVKGGRFFPTYGLRVQDDEAFIRSETGNTFQRQDEGVEFGFGPGPFFLATSITNGTAGDRDVAVTVNGYTLLQDIPVVRNILAGASFSRINNKRDSEAFYAGSNLWNFTYLAELDLIDDRQPGSATQHEQFASYFELDWLLFDWLNLRGTAEFLKVTQNRDRTRYSIGLEPFISRFIQPRIQYRINNGDPTDVQQNQDELWFELHMFL